MNTIIVIPQSRKDELNTWFKEEVDKEGGELTFTCGLSPDGNLPITHYWCSIFLSDIPIMDDSGNVIELSLMQKCIEKNIQLYNESPDDVLRKRKLKKVY